MRDFDRGRRVDSEDIRRFYLLPTTTSTSTSSTCSTSGSTSTTTTPGKSKDDGDCFFEDPFTGADIDPLADPPWTQFEHAGEEGELWRQEGDSAKFGPGPDALREATAVSPWGELCPDDHYAQALMVSLGASDEGIGLCVRSNGQITAYVARADSTRVRLFYMHDVGGVETWICWVPTPETAPDR